MEKIIFTTSIRCEVYEPMAGRVDYRYGEEGIPQPADIETRHEMGCDYTIVSPMSPYAVGWSNWRKIEALAEGRAFDEVAEATVNWVNRTITVYKKEFEE